MKVIKVFLIIFLAIIANSLNAQFSSAAVGDKTTKDIKNQISLIDQQLSQAESKKATEVALVNKWRESVDTISEDNFDAEILLAKIDSTYNSRLSIVNAKYNPQIEVLTSLKIQLLANMASTNEQNYIKGSGSAKSMAMLYTVGQIYGGNGNSNNKSAVSGSGVAVNSKNTAVTVTITCRENTMLSQTFTLVAGEYREFPAIPGMHYVFTYYPQSGPSISVEKVGLLSGTFEYSRKTYIVGSKCFDKNIGGSYY